MKLIILFVIAAGLAGIYLYLRKFLRRRRRRALLAGPFPGAWREILERNLAPYRHLPPALKGQLEDRIRVFIGEKRFEGCGGLELTDEIRVTIAAQACLLLLNRETDCYPQLFSVLVYPSTYVASVATPFGPEPDENAVRLGESWQHGALVLAWDSVRGGAVNFRDGRNVTMHEFAHQLDQEDGRGDGAPILGRRSAYSAWSRVFSHEYEKLQRKAARGKKGLLDHYGATNPAEFFAVATETFFEKPGQMKRKHPELYHELQGFYRVDPAEWQG